MTPEQRQLLARLIADTRVQVDQFPAIPGSELGPSVNMVAIYDSPGGSRAVRFITTRTIYLPVGTAHDTPRTELLTLAIQALGVRAVRAIASQLDKFDRLVAEVSP